MSANPADETAAALLDTWQVLMRAHPEAWAEVSDGISACRVYEALGFRTLERWLTWVRV